MLHTLDDAIRRALSLVSPSDLGTGGRTGRRVIIGIAGKPGSGKSTLANDLVAALAPTIKAVVVPMDGFHLTNTELVALGLRNVKGNIATFDAPGYAALLHRLHQQDIDDAGDTVWAPAYDRANSTTVGSAIRVDPDVPLVITEGNYLLCDGAPWQRARVALTETWYVDIDDDVRVPRLVARHIANGRTPADAVEWVTRSDEANARLIAATAHRADVVYRPA